MDVPDEQLDELYRAGFRVAYRLLADMGDAQDCAQEATARALARWARISDHAIPWVVRVSANLAIGQLRKRRRVVVGLDLDGSVSSAELPEALATRMDLRADLLALSARQRQALVLRYLADLSEEETAEAMGIRLGSVKTHTRRGLARMRQRSDGGGER